MTTKELIERLNTYHPDDQVWMCFGNKGTATEKTEMVAGQWSAIIYAEGWDAAPETQSAELAAALNDCLVAGVPSRPAYDRAKAALELYRQNAGVLARKPAPSAADS